MTDLILRDLKQVKYREFKKTLKHRMLDFDKIGQNVEEIRKMNMDHYKEKNLYTLNDGEYISDDQADQEVKKASKVTDIVELTTNPG